MIPLTDAGIAIEEGLQGGYHVDVSLSILGVIDPDRANILISMTLGNRVLAQHRTDNWLLKLFDDYHCEYPEARLVFAKEDGSLLELDQVIELVGQTVHLDASVETPKGSAMGRFNFVLSELIRQDAQ